MSSISDNASLVPEEKNDSVIWNNRTVPSLSALCFPSIQALSLHPIDLSTPLPVTSLGATCSKDNAGTTQYEYNHHLSQMGIQQGAVPPCLKTRRFKCRKEAFYKSGLREHWVEQKRLITAVHNRDELKVSELLEFGLDPNVSDSKQRTPLHIAASQGDHNIVQRLLSKRADPTQQDILGNTALHLAVCRGDLESVRILIENGSNIFIRDNSGRTPLSLVRNRLHGVRRNKDSSTRAFKTEFILMSELLCSSAARQIESNSFVSSIDELCSQMQAVSTREKADEIAEAAMQEMSNAVSSVSLSNISLL